VLSSRHDFEKKWRLRINEARDERSWIVALPAPPPPPPALMPLFEAPQDHAATGNVPNGDGIVSVPTGGIIGSPAKAVPAAVTARMDNATAIRRFIFMVCSY
jgi:hypothetical protein